MNLLTLIPKLKATRPKQIISESWAERHCILDDEVNLFCWSRPENAEITEYLRGCLQMDLKPISFATNKEDLPSKLSRSRYRWDADHSTRADDFWIDVYQLIQDFLFYSQHDMCRVHLSIVHNNACTKFHIDGYPLRLITTYIGPGTEWLCEEATNRSGLGKSNELIVKKPNMVQKMDTYDVGILKGEIPNLNASTKGIVHRSPSIEGSSQKRIVLRVDL